MQKFFYLNFKTICSINLLSFKKHTVVVLGYFFIISLLGLLLRFFFVIPVNWNFEHLLHTHSHVSLLGWLFLGMSLIIYRVFLKGCGRRKTKNHIFLVFNISFVGMLIAFPLQGYGLYSIAFSTLYLLTTYWFSWFTIKNIPEEIKDTFSWKLARMGLFYLVLSSFGTWAIGPISASAGTDSFWFNDALYFFLHFLYSGFFFLILISVLFRILEKRKVRFSKDLQDKFYVYLNTGIFLSYFLSVIWKKPSLIFYFLGIIGALYQIYGYFLFFKILQPHKKEFQKIFSKYSYFLLKLASALLIIRILMQLISGFPYFAELAFEFKGFIIGYLHMVFLGILTPVLLVLMAHFKMLKFSGKNLNLFLFTFLITEFLIFYQAFAFWLKLPQSANHFKILAGFSCLFPIALGWLLFGNLKLAFSKKQEGL